MATLQNLGVLKYRDKDGNWKPLPVVVQDADGGVSTMYGRDVSGPTALLHSVSRLPFEKASNGTLLNMKFLPQFFKTQTGIVKFTQLLRAVYTAYFTELARDLQDEIIARTTYEAI